MQTKSQRHNDVPATMRDTESINNTITDTRSVLLKDPGAEDKLLVEIALHFILYLFHCSCKLIVVLFCILFFIRREGGGRRGEFLVSDFYDTSVQAWLY